MKITITVDTDGESVEVRRHGNGKVEILLDCALDARTGEEVAALVAKTIGIAVAKEIAATAGGE